jgi:NADH-quinone oxidoreductase subunit H
MDCTGLCEALYLGGMDQGLAQFLSIFAGVLLVSGVPLITVIFLIWVERKVAARIQDRIGPNRVGPFGLLQTFADLIKLLLKEDITPTSADRLLYNLAPLVSFASVILIWAVIPYTPYHYGVDLEIGVLYFVAVASLGTLAIMTAGWASNNKYALLGAFRVVALLVSYEIPLIFSLMIPVMLAGSMSMLDIIYAQSGMWFVFLSPLGAVLFFISSQAETGRAPFDLIEAESELVAGFNIEYSGMKFGMFFAAEFLHVFTNAVLISILFFGGWLGLLWNEPLIAFLWLGIKSALFYFVSLWIRNTVPRLRIDQVMNFNWFFLVPLSIILVLVTAGIVMVFKTLGLVPLDAAGNMQLAGANLLDMLPLTLALLAANALMIAPILNRWRNIGREARLANERRQQARMTSPAVGD